MALFLQSAEEKEFAKRSKASRKNDQRGSGKGSSRFIEWYRLRNPSKDGIVDTIFQIIAIPEEMKEYFKGRYIPVPRFGKLHTFVGVSGKLAEKKSVLNMFPKSKQSDIRCTGDDSCLVCEKYQELHDKYQELDERGELSPDQKNHVKSLSWNFTKKGKAKDVVIFLACVYTRNPKDRSVWDKHLEIFKISENYWNRHFGKGVFDKRTIKRSKWVDQNYDKVFEYDGETIKLSDLDEKKDSDKIYNIFLEATEAEYKKYGNPWHMLEGFKMTYTQDGDMNKDSEVDVDEDEGASPYFPPALIKQAKGKQKKRMLELEDESKELYDFIVENIEKVPDIDKYFPKSITSEEQAKVLGVSDKSEKSNTEDIEDIEDTDEDPIIDDNSDVEELDEDIVDEFESADIEEDEIPF